MRFVIQSVSRAEVEIEGGEKSADALRAIGKGFVVLVGVGQGDDARIADKMVAKLLGLRIFADENGKTNLSLADVNGALLLISQFTLYADCRKGNRPSFTGAASPGEANALYEYVVEKCRERVGNVATGVFGAHMRLSLTNEGPFTVILDSDALTGSKRAEDSGAVSQGQSASL